MSTDVEQGLRSSMATRAIGAIVLAACAPILVMLVSPGRVASGRWTLGPTPDGQSLFGWPHAIPLCLLAACGIAAMVGGNRATSVIAAATGTVPAAMLAGAGIVARRRWHPVAGPGPGHFSNHEGLVAVAGIAAVAGLAALAALLVALRRLAALPMARSRGARARVVAVAAVIAATMPLLTGIGRSMSYDAMSLGAFGFLWSVPWGATVALTGWLPRRAGVGVGLAIAVCAVSACQQTDIVHVAHHAIPVAIGVVSGLLVAALHGSNRGGRPSGLVAQQTG